MPSADPLALLDAEHRAVSDTLDAMTPGARLWRPAPEVWHAADVLEHLVKTERGMLRGVRRQVEAGERRREVGAPSPEAVDALSGFLRSDRRTRVPAAAARFVAPAGAPYDELRAEWDAAPGLWRELLAALPPELEGVGLVQHPVAGPLTATGTVRFLADHAHHHARQLARIREADGFPLA